MSRPPGKPAKRTANGWQLSPGGGYIAEGRKAVPAFKVFERLLALEAEVARGVVLRDHYNGLECLPGCDSDAHEDHCPVVDPAGAIRRAALLEAARLARHDQRLTGRQHTGRAIAQWLERLADQEPTDG